MSDPVQALGDPFDEQVGDLEHGQITAGKRLVGLRSCRKSASSLGRRYSIP
jgi:hypothetical protein